MKIVVLYGGTSTERDVSLVSGKDVYTALKRRGHQVVLVDVYLGVNTQEVDVNTIFDDCDSVDYAEGIAPIAENRHSLEDIIEQRENPELGFFGPGVIDICRKSDIVFLALHGMNGEDGRIQATFDLLGIKYTGTDYVSSAIAMDKGLTKDTFMNHGVLTPAGFSLRKGEKITHEVPYPAVVKASHGGSSIGVYYVDNKEEFENALVEAFKIDDQVVVEQRIYGTEFTDLVMDGQAYPIVKITPLKGTYDYKNKYQAGSTEEICPAPISDELTNCIQQLAIRAYHALRLQVYARMDFIVDESGQVFCLEANTLPGMTPTSLIPQEAAAAGIEYDELCEKLVTLSLKKYDN